MHKSARHLALVISLLAVLALLGWWLLSQPQAMQVIATSLDFLKQQPLIYAVILALVTAVMLPPFAVIVLGGFLYGATKGALISSIAYLIGAIASFYVGRYFGQPAVARISAKRPSIRALNLAIERKGLLMVLLSRLALVLPYNLLNVVLGASQVSLKHYIIGTWIGTLPMMIINSILGDTAPGLLDILQGNVKLEIGSHYVIGFGVAVILLLVLIVRWSGKQLQHELATQNDSP